MKHHHALASFAMAAPKVDRGQSLAGFTLLEISFLLAITGTLATVGLQLYQLQKTELNLQVAKARINTMHRALNDFYAMHCFKVLGAKAQTETNEETSTENSTQSVDDPDVSREILVNLGLLSSFEDSVNPFDGHFSPSINWDSTPVTVTVSTVGNSSPASVWRNYYLPSVPDPSKVQGMELAWTRIASVVSNINQIEQQSYTNMYREFTCQ